MAHVNLTEKGEGIRTRVSVNDILVTITVANVTKTAFVAKEIKEAYVNQHVALVRLHESEQAPYVWLWLISPEHGRTQLLDAAYGAGKPGLNLKQVRDVLISIPPLPEQHEIVRQELVFSTSIVLLENDETSCLDGDYDRSALSVGGFYLSCSWHYLSPAWRSLKPILDELERLKKQLFPDQWNKRKTYRDYVLELKEWKPEEREAIKKKFGIEDEDCGRPG